MRIRVVALGHRMPEWVVAGWNDYARRLPREYALEVVELKPAARDRGKTVAQLLESEAAQIESACRNASMLALDEHGAAWTTRELARWLTRSRDDNRDVALVIGSADGLAPQVKARAAAVVSLSAMTLPHGLVRVVVAEQIYRAVTLAAGHPYHRE